MIRCCRSSQGLLQILPGWEQAAVNEPTWHFLFGIWSPKWMVNLLGVFQYTYSYNHIHVHIHISMNIWMWVWIDKCHEYTHIYRDSYQSWRAVDTADKAAVPLAAASSTQSCVFPCLVFPFSKRPANVLWKLRDCNEFLNLSKHLETSHCWWKKSCTTL